MILNLQHQEACEAKSTPKIFIIPTFQQRKQSLEALLKFDSRQVNENNPCSDLISIVLT
jgi:hypothetical protein